MKKLLTLFYFLALTGFSYAQYNINQSLVTPSPTAEATKLYQFLKDNYTKKIVSGAVEMTEVNWLKQNTGKEPALMGTDFLFIGRGYTWYNDNTPANDVINWYNRNGIPTLCWHWRDPSRRTEYFYTQSAQPTEYTSFDITKIWDTNSSEYRAMISDIDYTAGQLKRIRDAGVPVLWRPLHEAAGGWFWWGKDGPACKKLWQVMYDRLVNYHGLRNLIWVWTKEANDDAFYPGDAYVDIVSRDYYYTGNHGSIVNEFTSISSKFGNKKLTTISECGSFPDPDNLVNDKAHWSWFMVWGGDYTRSATYNPLSLWQKAFNHSYVLTLDEMPNLRTYTTPSTGCGTASNGFPICCNGSASDPDGDGWGWENNASCYVQTTTLGTGKYRITARHSGKVLDVAGASTADGADVTQYSSYNTTNQQWTVTALGNSQYSIRAVHSGKSLDVYNNSTADGADINQWSYSGNNNQRWRVESVGSGYYRIVSVNSGKCIDIPGSSTADGTPINQWGCSGNTNQQFQFSYLGSAREGSSELVSLEERAQVYPNPSAGTFTVRQGGAFSYDVLDSSGKALQSGRGVDQATVGSSLTPGFYLLQVKGEKGTQTLKLIKQ